jgi:hypothetical protein
MFRFFEIFGVCFHFCNGLLVGWLLSERSDQSKPESELDSKQKPTIPLLSIYPRIRVPKKLILLYYLLALLFFGMLSLYMAITEIICP